MANRQRATILVIVAAVTVLGTACRVSIGGGGDRVTRSFDVGDFSRIEISQSFEAEIVVGEEAGVEVQADEELIDRVQVGVDGDQLTVGLDGGLVWTTGELKVRITTPELEALAANGAARVDVEGIDAASLELRLDGASEVTADGSVDRLTLDANGASRADLDALSVERATVDLDGASSADFGDLGEVEGTVGGASSLDVPDSTTVDVATSGAGSVN